MISYVSYQVIVVVFHINMHLYTIILRMQGYGRIDSRVTTQSCQQDKHLKANLEF